MGQLSFNANSRSGISKLNRIALLISALIELLLKKLQKRQKRAKRSQ
jgi:hypothetical protein